MTYDLCDAPNDVLSDVNRHSPHHCDKCGLNYVVEIKIQAKAIEYVNGPNYVTKDKDYR